MINAIAQMILSDRKIAYAVTDRDLNVIEISSVGSIFQEYRGNCLGRPLTEIVPELIGNDETLARVVNGELPRFQLAWVNRKLPNGQTAYLTMVDLPYRDQTERIVGLIHVAQDTTEMGVLGQRATQQRNELLLARDQLSQQNVQLAAANAELQRLDETKSAFVSIAAHELRTPLSAIFGYLEMLLGGDAGALNERQTEYMQVIEDSARRLMRITSDLLDVTRLETGRLELVLQPTDLAALAEAVAAEHAPQFETKSQRLILRAARRLPRVLCDAARTEQIISNLLSNSAKYSPPGGAIMLSLAEADDPGFLQITVADQGIGIPPEDQPQLFKPFFRASNAPLAATNGAGLGLYIARSLVDLHSGHIWFDSTLGKGTTFHVTLPLADAPHGS
jgi:signal transduction histidine kinase